MGVFHKPTYMIKSTYDSDGDGVVDEAEAFEYDTAAGPPTGTGTDGRDYFDSTNNRWYRPRPGALTTWDALN
jgi:hypothetical protein